MHTALVDLYTGLLTAITLVVATTNTDLVGDILLSIVGFCAGFLYARHLYLGERDRRRRRRARAN